MIRASPLQCYRGILESGAFLTLLNLRTVTLGGVLRHRGSTLRHLDGRCLFSTTALKGVLLSEYHYDMEIQTYA